MDISVITTVYNSEKFISECILSVANQITENKFSYEHIIVDDGSTDNTKKIIKRYQKVYNNITYVNIGKVGRARALNLAVEKAKGNLIANLDVDDLFHPKKLMCQWRFLMNHEEVDLLSTGSINFNDKLEFANLNNFDVSFIGEELLKRNTIMHSSVIFRKQAFFDVGKYSENRSMQIDLDLWYKFLINNRKMCNIDSKLSAKRIHKEQSFENKKRITYIVSSFNLKRRYILKMKKYKFLPHIYLKLFFDALPIGFRNSIKNTLSLN